MNYLKEGPGPATRNIRDGADPLASFKPKKITSLKTGFSLHKREVGLPQPNFANPAPNAYQQESQLVEHNLKKSNLVFNKMPNNLDMARYGQGMEEFTIKGLL